MSTILFSNNTQETFEFFSEKSLEGEELKVKAIDRQDIIKDITSPAFISTGTDAGRQIVIADTSQLEAGKRYRLIFEADEQTQAELYVKVRDVKTFKG